MYYSDDVINEVLSRNDIVDVIGSYASLKKKGANYEACCPFHHEKTPSFKVNREKTDVSLLRLRSRWQRVYICHGI